ncbi:MAG: CapA family protein [Myxococcales bacterium]|nr:CapA family protein [Myxococcales bacterium]MCB9582421.1 CapA family protein [Polyangiaceae bacterium]
MFRPLALTLFAILALLLGCDGKQPEEQPAPAASVVPPAVKPAVPEKAAPEAPAEKLTVLFGGDVNLGRGAGQKILKNPKYDPFSEIAPLLATADLRAVNLESQLSDQNGETQSPKHHLIFTGPPGGADVLGAAHIDLVSLANNHSWDYGKKALFETFDNLERAGVAYTGARRKPNAAYEPTVLTIKGWRVAIFGVTHIWNQGPFDKHEGRFYVAWASFDNLQKQLRRAKKEYDLVLVSYHGGGEYVEVPMQWTRDFVRAVMSTGVDGFFGSHPHVPHGVGWSQTRPVFYSLGNLVFAMHSDYPWTGTSFMARVTYHRDGRIEAEACPYHILGHVPMPFEGKVKEARETQFRSHLKLLSAATGGSEVGAPGELSCMPVSPKKRPGVDG